MARETCTTSKSEIQHFGRRQTSVRGHIYKNISSNYNEKITYVPDIIKEKMCSIKQAVYVRGESCSKDELR